jgi:hypothetical protein
LSTVFFNSVLEGNGTLHIPFAGIYIGHYVPLDGEDENADYYHNVEEAEAEEGLLTTYQQSIGWSILSRFKQITVDDHVGFSLITVANHL